MEIIAFQGTEQIVSGPAGDALPVLRAFARERPDARWVVLNRYTSQTLSVDLNNSDAELEASLALQAGETPRHSLRGRGRPRLGVRSREVSLLPRHWDWLNQQSGGASAALRRLVDSALEAPEVRAEQARLAVERFLHTLARDLPHYEEALRQFHRNQYGLMFEQMAEWPDDIQRHIRWLASQAQYWTAQQHDDRRR